MSTLDDALFLMRRQRELEIELRHPGCAGVIQEQELFAVRTRLQAYPEAVKAILSTAEELHRPIDSIGVDDVLRSA